MRCSNCFWRELVFGAVIVVFLIVCVILFDTIGSKQRVIDGLQRNFETDTLVVWKNGEMKYLPLNGWRVLKSDLR